MNGNAGINDFHTKGKALDISLKGSASDLLGPDPLFDIDGGLSISLDTLGQFIRKNTGIAVSGRLSANAKGKIRMSQISPYSFAEADLAGFIRSDRLDVHSEKDSIDLSIDSLDILLATMWNRFDRRVEKGTSMIAQSASLDSTSIKYKDAFSVSGSDLSLRAQNDAAILDAEDSSSYYPFSGRLEIGRLSMTDSDTSRIVLRNSTNTFRISPSRADKEIPVLSLKSDSKAIRLKAAFDRASVRDLGINIVATKSDARRKRMARAFVDSLARRFPDVPRDSLFSHLRKMRGTVTLPDWLSEEDFRKLMDQKLSMQKAEYLGSRRAYAELFQNVGEDMLHRSGVERRLWLSLFRDFDKLYRFGSVKQKRFIRMYFGHYEVKLVKECLQAVLGGHAAGYEFALYEDLIRKYAKIDIMKLSRSRDIGDFIENLKGTSYYSILKRLYDSGQAKAVDYETAIDMRYFVNMWRQKDKVLSREECGIVERTFGSRIDMLNVDWIYRAKKYFDMAPKEIYRLLETAPSDQENIS